MTRTTVSDPLGLLSLTDQVQAVSGPGVCSPRYLNIRKETSATVVS